MLRDAAGTKKKKKSSQFYHAKVSQLAFLLSRICYIQISFNFIKTKHDKHRSVTS